MLAYKKIEEESEIEDGFSTWYIETNTEAFEHIMSQGGSGGDILRALLKHYYNSSNPVDLFKIMTGLDDENKELALNIIEFFTLYKEQTYFPFINDIYPQLVKIGL